MNSSLSSQPHLLASLQRNLAKLPPSSKFIVALSGGVDSIVLAHILKTLGYPLILAHFNHGWRGKESDKDQAFVEKLAQDWGLPIEIAKSKKPTQGNAEDYARRERYLFLEAVRQKHQADSILLAHHRDDQIETILMHQKRGAGLRGLSGMPFQRGYLIRPLLEVKKTELIDYAHEHQLSWREDSSNQNLNFTRNQLRQGELPKLKAQDPYFEENLLKTSQQARQKLKALAQKAESWIQNHLKGPSFDQAAFLALRDELQSEILLQILGPINVYRATLRRLKNWIQQGQSGTKLTVKGQTFWREHEAIYLEPNQEEKLEFKKIRLTKKTLPWGPWQIQNLSDTPLFVRSWQAGDRFQPSGMQGHKKVQDFFVDAKIPKHLRHQLPLIFNKKGEILSIANLRFSEEGKGLKTQLKITPLP